MPKFNVPEDVTIEDFFRDFVPKQFEETIGGVDLSFLDDAGFTLSFDIEGKKFGVKVTRDKKMEIVEGGIEKPLLEIKLTEKFWRESVTGKVEGAVDQFTDTSQISVERFETLKGTKGTMKAELTKSDGEVVNITLIFNGESAPEVTLRLAMEDWIAMQKKEADGTQLFMAGKIQFSGDMMFLMSLQALM